LSSPNLQDPDNEQLKIDVEDLKSKLAELFSLKEQGLLGLGRKSLNSSTPNLVSRKAKGENLIEPRE